MCRRRRGRIELKEIRIVPTPCPMLSNAIDARETPFFRPKKKNIQKKIEKSLIALCTFPLSFNASDALCSVYCARHKCNNNEIDSDCILVSYSLTIFAGPLNFISIIIRECIKCIKCTRDVAAFELIIWHVFVQENGMELNLFTDERKIDFLWGNKSYNDNSYFSSCWLLLHHD